MTALSSSQVIMKRSYMQKCEINYNFHLTVAQAQTRSKKKFGRGGISDGFSVKFGPLFCIFGYFYINGEFGHGNTP